MDLAVTHAATHDATSAVTSRRPVIYPSTEFPGPPTIGLSVPDSWIAIDPADYLLPNRRVDLAVRGPAPIDGVTPSVAGSVLRTLPASDPERFLTDLLQREIEQSPELEFVTSQYRHQPRPTVCGVTRSQFPGMLMEHLQVLAYVHDDRLAHVIYLTGVYAARSKQGRADIFDILGPTAENH